MKLAQLVEDASLLLKGSVDEVNIDVRLLRRVQHEEGSTVKKACMDDLVSEIQSKIQCEVKKLPSGSITLKRRPVLHPK